MKVKDLIKLDEFKWANLFIRDLLLTLVLMVINYLTHFRSWWAAFITGMLFVWISWHFSDYINYKKLRRWS